MAKNKKSPAQQAAERYQVKKNYDYFYTPEEKAKDRHKVNKEYKKIEKREKLPGFIITLVIFIIFIGVFAGLYTQYDYELEFTPKEYQEIDISDSSKVLSKQIGNSFISFFSLLNDISSLADSVVNVVFDDNTLSDNPDINVYLLSLRNQAYLDADKQNIIFAFLDKRQIDLHIRAFANPDCIHILKGYFLKGSFHRDYAHLPDLTSLKLYPFNSWNVDEIHEKFVELKICHRYNGELYKYCDY